MSSDRCPEFDHDGMEVYITKSAIRSGYLVSRGRDSVVFDFLGKDLKWGNWRSDDIKSQHRFHFRHIKDAIIACEESTGLISKENEWNDHE